MYFSDDNESEYNEEHIVRYKPILYAKASHQTNSIPLEHEWFLLDSLKLKDKTEIPLMITESVPDHERIVQLLNNNRFILSPWSLDEITDHARNERRVIGRRDIHEDDSEKISVDSRIRVIKDFGYSGFNTLFRRYCNIYSSCWW